MATIVVDTTSDAVADDGKTSLREALATAMDAVGHTDIVFSEAAFMVANQVVTMSLASTLTISKGDITIDGSLFYGGPYSSVTISSAGLSANAITVEAGARVVLRDLSIEGTTQTTLLAAYGAEGTPGISGVNGANGYAPGHEVIYGDGTPGTSGTDAQAAPNDAGYGSVAVGGIVNRGTLTLERVALDSFRVQGGAGGVAGEGGQGGNGGNGERGSDADDPSHPAGGSGGNAGNGAAGSIGGAGGDAAAGIYNVGALTMRDVSFSALSATGGNGGRGGDGGWGGAGGDYGRAVWPDVSAHGGDGGNGGNGGRGGNGGSAAAAVFNGGTLTIEGVQSKVIGTALVGGTGASGGLEGSGGTHGKEYASGFDTPNQDGIDGVDGVAGARGANGATGDFLGANVTTAASFIIDAAKTVISDTGTERQRTVYFAVTLMGGSPSGGTVKVKYTPGHNVTAADFENGILPTPAPIVFSSESETHYFGVIINDDGKSEGLESFTISLTDPTGGKLGYSKAVTIYLTDEAPDANGFAHGNAPSAVKLKLAASSISEGSISNGKTVGTLSTSDPDKGDHFTYSLLDNAGGAFVLSGSTLKVANGVKLDYEQAHSKTVVVRSTDIFGNSVDKAFSIKIKDVASETVNGTSAADTIKGGSRTDKFDGKAGSDTLTGGGGNDWFTFTAKLGASNVDHITDFSHGHDKIRLDDAVFKHISKGTLASKFFYPHATAHDKDDHILYDRPNGALYYDADGKGGAAAVLFAVLDNHAALSNGDVLIV